MDADQLPVPYRVYGQSPPHASQERRVPWETEIDALRHQWPQLNAYPQFSAMIDTVSRFTAELSTAETSRWRPGHGWTHDPTAAARHAQQTLYAREDRAHSTHPRHTPGPPPPAAGPRQSSGPPHNPRRGLRP